MDGWNFALLRVNLTEKTASTEDVSEEMLHNYVGGRGLGAKILYEEARNVQPLSADNKIIICVGPLTGTIAPSSSRLSATTRSPLTATVFDSNCGGDIAVAIKSRGYDCIIIEGAADEPIIIYVGSQVKILSAKNLWGLTTSATLQKLEQKYRGARALVIGPAGEHKVLFASVLTRHGRALGRGGLGAVMGAKNVKAIVVEPCIKPRAPINDKMRSIAKEVRKWISASPITSKALPQYGTAVLLGLVNNLGLLPVYNFRKSADPRADNVSGENLRKYVQRKDACYNCQIACGRVLEFHGLRVFGPEYESIWALGPECGIFDLDHVIRSAHICNELGMDTISAGVTLGTAMELTDKGHADIIRFGDREKARSLLFSMAYRSGVGNLLAEGAKRLAETFNAPELAMHVKGLELPAYHPGKLQGQALAYATSNRGGCHLRAYLLAAEVLGIPTKYDRGSFSDKPDLVVKIENLFAVLDSLISCKFTAFVVNEDYYARMLTAATGMDYTSADLEKVGERIWNIERLYNVDAGFSRSDDTLPLRFLSPAEKNEGAVRLAEMLDIYYEIRSWDHSGVPRVEKLQQLGIRPHAFARE